MICIFARSGGIPYNENLVFERMWKRQKMQKNSVMKNPKTFTGGRHYFQFLISYFVILCIPIAILMGFYSSHFMRKFKNEVYETIDLELQQAAAKTDSEISHMKTTGRQFSIGGLLATAAKAKSPLDLVPVMNWLNIVSNSNPFISDIALFLGKSDYIVTSTTTWNKQFFYSHNFSDIQKAQAVFERDLSDNQEVMDVFASDTLAWKGEGGPFVAISSPIFSGWQQYEGKLVFSIAPSEILNLFSRKMGIYHAQLFVVGQDGSVLASSYTDKALVGMVGSFPTEAGTCKTKERNYLVRMATSEVTGWRYYAFIDFHTTFAPLESVTHSCTIALILTVLLASLAIILLQRLNYTPIRNLKQKADALLPEHKSHNEMKDISNAMDYLSTTNSKLESRLERSMEAVRSLRLDRLISGEYATLDEFNMDTSELGLSMPYPFFTVAILLIRGQIDEKALQDASRQVAEVQAFFCGHQLHPSQLVVLINSKQNSKQPILQLLALLQESSEGEITIGLGCTTSDTGKLSTSYLDAATALDYRFIKGNGAIIDFSEIPLENKANLYPNKEFSILENALIAQDDQRADQAIGNIIIQLQQEGMPVYLARSICADLIHIVRGHAVLGKPDNPDFPMEISRIETVKDAIHLVQDWLQRLHASRPQEEKVTMEEVILYLKANYDRCDFSVYETAEHFHMTLPQFSKFFKDNTSSNVLDYSISLRLEKAKHLLVHTDMPLKELAEQVGYYNLSSFTRRFKLNVGMSPSEYRIQHAVNGLDGTPCRPGPADSAFSQP